MIHISLAETDRDIDRCHPAMAELRPHVAREGFVARVRRQARGGYRLAFLEEDGAVRAVAGFRVSECLAWGKFLYVDDLVTAGAARSRRHGAALLRWLADLARKEGCGELHLDSGVQRFEAHRFYLRERMAITCHHFAIALAAPPR
jgi:GNAT superfamily N-acetyltransferase